VLLVGLIHTHFALGGQPKPLLGAALGLELGQPFSPPGTSRMTNGGTTRIYRRRRGVGL